MKDRIALGTARIIALAVERIQKKKNKGKEKKKKK